jgi:hypothetical protein
MEDIREQMDMANEVSDAIAQPLGMDYDEDELNAELEELEQATLNEKLSSLDEGQCSFIIIIGPRTRHSRNYFSFLFCFGSTCPRQLAPYCSWTATRECRCCSSSASTSRSNERRRC